MREIQVHAASGAEALTDGAAALQVDPGSARVEILESDEHGVTARVWVTVEPAEPEPGEPGEDDDGRDPAARHLAEIVRLMGVDAEVEVVSSSDDEIALDILGDDLGPVIGSFGQTLNAVQFLINIMVNRDGPRRRVVIDAEGYRERRRERLESLALEHARRAKEERRDVILEGLRAAERRIIHTTLQDDPDVATYSEGEEPHRRLIISPRH